MKNIIESIRKQYPVSDLTIKELESYLTPCSFPKRYQLIKEGIYCKYAYFIEKGYLKSLLGGRWRGIHYLVRSRGMY